MKEHGRTMQERDSELEATYSFERDDEYQEVPAFVALHRDDLCREFFDWRAARDGEQSVADALLWFEEERFGRPLEPAAHAMLWFIVRQRMKHGVVVDQHWPSEGARVAVEDVVRGNPREDGEGLLDWIERVSVQSGLMLPSAAKKPLLKPMPTAAVEMPVPYKDDPPEGPPAWATPQRAIEVEDDGPPVDWLEEE